MLLLFITNILQFSMGLLVFLSTVFIFSFIDQFKSIRALFNNESIIYKSNPELWYDFVNIFCKIDKIPLFLCILVNIYGLFSKQINIVYFSAIFFMWKYLSLYWPTKFAFNSIGIYTWNPFMGVNKPRKNNFYKWTDFKEIIIVEKLNILICIDRTFTDRLNNLIPEGVFFYLESSKRKEIENLFRQNNISYKVILELNSDNYNPIINKLIK